MSSEVHRWLSPLRLLTQLQKHIRIISFFHLVGWCKGIRPQKDHTGRTDPGKGGWGANSHWPEVGTGHGCDKQSASDKGTSYHFNPQFLALLCLKMDKRLLASGAKPPEPHWGCPLGKFWISPCTHVPPGDLAKSGVTPENKAGYANIKIGVSKMSISFWAQ